MPVCILSARSRRSNPLAKGNEVIVCVDRDSSRGLELCMRLAGDNVEVRRSGESGESGPPSPSPPRPVGPVGATTLVLDNPRSWEISQALAPSEPYDRVVILQAYPT